MERIFLMRCPNCTREVPDDALFCCYCGKKTRSAKQGRRKTRGNGSGCAYKRGKTWTACITPEGASFIDEKGKIHQPRKYKGGFKTKNEALVYCETLKQKGTKAKAPNLLHYWNMYEKDDLEKLGKDKQVAYRGAWKKMQSLQYRKVDTLTVQDLRQVVAEKTSTYYPARDMKTLLRRLFELAAADRYVDKDLPEFIVLPELEEMERQPFTKEEQEALWKIYDAGDRRAALPLIMIYTGMMPGEMQNLKCDMVRLDEQRIVGVSMKTKVRKKSPVYLPDTIIPVLIGEIAASQSKLGYVWFRNEKGFYDRYYAALEAAGCRRLEPYSCRHTTATALAIDKNIAPQTIKKVMRWSTTKMLDKYAHPDDTDAMQAINHLHRSQEEAPE
jgi:integrase